MHTDHHDFGHPPTVGAGGKLTPTSPQMVGGTVSPGGGMVIGEDGIQRSRRKMGGSYSTYTGPSPNNGYGGGNGGNGIAGLVGFMLNNTDGGELVDTSGRRIKTDAYTNLLGGEGNVGGGATL